MKQHEVMLDLLEKSNVDAANASNDIKVNRNQTSDNEFRDR